MELKQAAFRHKGKNFLLNVRPGTQDEPMAREVYDRDYYQSYGGLTIEPGDIVVDLGANVGSFSILAGIAGATVYAVEAHPETIKILEGNLQNNASLFSTPPQIFNGAVVGVTPPSGKRLFRLPADPKNTGIATIVEGEDPGLKESVEVEALSLADLTERFSLSRIDFLKLDIEGGEYEVLLETPPFTFNSIKQISLEWHDGPEKLIGLVGFLINRGYVVAWFDGDQERGRLQLKRI